MIAARRAGTAVVCVNYGSSALLADALADLSGHEDLSVVVVDNFSTAAERERVRDLGRGRGWVVVESPNGGFGAGCNAGVAASDRDTVVLVNPDAVLSADAVRRLAAEARGADGPCLVAPRVVRPDGSVWSEGSDLYLDDGRIRSVRRRGEHPGAERELWLSGAVLALTRDSWDLVGGFDDSYFLYWEDVDLSYRMVRAGGTLKVLPDVVAVHAEGGTQSGGLQRSGEPKSDLYYRYNIRNRLLFGAQHLPGDRWRRWLLATPAVTWEILLQGGRRQFLTRPGLGLLAVRAVAEGLRLGRRVRRPRRRAEAPRSA